jgi:hypothetical protein
MGLNAFHAVRAYRGGMLGAWLDVEPVAGTELKVPFLSMEGDAARVQKSTLW